MSSLSSLLSVLSVLSSLSVWLALLSVVQVYHCVDWWHSDGQCAKMQCCGLMLLGLCEMGTPRGICGGISHCRVQRIGCIHQGSCVIVGAGIVVVFLVVGVGACLPANCF